MMQENQMPGTVSSQAGDGAGQLKDAQTSAPNWCRYSSRQLRAYPWGERSEVNGKFITNKLTNKSNFNTKMCVFVKTILSGGSPL